MKRIQGFLVVVLLSASTMSHAQACPLDGHKKAGSCADGLVWDSATHQCMEKASS